MRGPRASRMRVCIARVAVIVMIGSHCINVVNGKFASIVMTVTCHQSIHAQYGSLIG